MKFKEIDNIDDLLKYLRKISPNRMDEYVSTCTSSDRLDSIIKNKKWYVNHPTKMNDRFEYSSFKEEWWGHKYFISFSEGNNESIAMWSMYGQPWDKGVMISIPSKILKKWKNEIRINMKYYLPLENGSFEERNEPLYTDITRVIYNDENKKIIKFNNSWNTNFKHPYKIKELTGYVKDIAWKYENEFRFVIETENTHNSRTIVIDVPDYVISNMIVTTSPRFKGKYNNKKVKNIEDSKFKDKLTYVYCDKCKETNKVK